MQYRVRRVGTAQETKHHPRCIRGDRHADGLDDTNVRMHDDQVDVDTEVARRLIATQFPEWSSLPVSAVTSTGTMNAIFRVGDALSARFPLRPGEVEAVKQTLHREAEAAREFADVSPFPAPQTVAVGDPGVGYPLPWTVQTWLTGHDALTSDPAASEHFAEDLARLIHALRGADTKGRRFIGNGRGGHLPDHDEWVRLCFEKSDGLRADIATLRGIWNDLRALPEVDPDGMCHGDLTPNNVIVEAGHLVGVLDVGGYAAADPALDLVSVWHLLDHQPRELVRQSLRCGNVQWRRGMAWAFQQAMGLVWYYAASNPPMSAWGHRTLNRLLEEYAS